MMKRKSNVYGRMSSESANNTTSSSSSYSTSLEEAIEWEMRPGGMLVQKRTQNADVSAPDISLRVAYGAVRYEISVNSQATFGEVKKLLRAETGLQAGEQRVIFKGKERENGEYLDICGVKDRSKVILMEDPASIERRFIEMRRNAKIQSAHRAINDVSMEVDQLADQLHRVAPDCLILWLCRLKAETNPGHQLLPFFGAWVHQGQGVHGAFIFCSLVLGPSYSYDFFYGCVPPAHRLTVMASKHSNPRVTFVSAIEKSISGGVKVPEVQVTTLIEMLMRQAIKLENIAAEGDAFAQKILQGKRVQKCVETLDTLKISNAKVKPVIVTTKWETFEPSPAMAQWEIFD
ncbi:hypothetical protein SCA6_005751 [Theobroma cacao]